MTDPRPEDNAHLREAAFLFRSGVVALPLVAVIFVQAFAMPIPDAAFVALILATLPLVTMAQLPLLDHATLERIPAYTSSVVMLAVLGSVGLVLAALGPGLEAVGLGLSFDAGDWLTTGAVAVGVATLAGVSHLVAERLGVEETRLLRELIPRSPEEKRLFALLSLMAGLSEEVVYRGYLVVVLGAIFSGPWWAAAASSLAFAVLHAYQGPVGIVRSGLLGFLFAAAFILGGSLWPLIIVHAGVDLVSGLWLGPRMLAEGGRSAS